MVRGRLVLCSFAMSGGCSGVLLLLRSGHDALRDRCCGCFLLHALFSSWLVVVQCGLWSVVIGQEEWSGCVDGTLKHHMC